MSLLQVDSWLLQLTVCGVTGRHGYHVLQTAVTVTRNGRGHVTTRRLATGAVLSGFRYGETGVQAERMSWYDSALHFKLLLSPHEVLFCLKVNEVLLDFLFLLFTTSIGEKV